MGAALDKGWGPKREDQRKLPPTRGGDSRFIHSLPPAHLELTPSKQTANKGRCLAEALHLQSEEVPVSRLMLKRNLLDGAGHEVVGILDKQEDGDSGGTGGGFTK
jgi:hypothetical protein